MSVAVALGGAVVGDVGEVAPSWNVLLDDVVEAAVVDVEPHATVFAWAVEVGGCFWPFGDEEPWEMAFGWIAGDCPYGGFGRVLECADLVGLVHYPEVVVGFFAFLCRFCPGDLAEVETCQVEPNSRIGRVFGEQVAKPYSVGKVVSSRFTS